MDQNLTEFNVQGKHFITRRQAIRMGGIVAAGLIFSRPIIDTILPRPLFAQYEPPPPPPPDGGCTPGRWKNKFDDWPVDDPNNPIDPLTTTLGEAFMFGDAPAVTSSTALLVFSEILVIDALRFQGGDTLPEKMEILLRIASASLLNSIVFVSPRLLYARTPAEVKEAVKSALNTEDPDVMLGLKNELDMLNNDSECRFNIDGED